jgi:hypothetical protein
MPIFKYIYKLGHCVPLCAEEFLVLTQSKPDEILVSGGYLFSNKLLDVNLSGGLIFGGEILEQLPFKSENKLVVLDKIENILKKASVVGENEYKKTGFSLDFPFDLTKLLKITKKYGVKNSVLLCEKTPNIGNYKSMKTWLVQIKLDNQTIIFKIQSYFNQEKWAKLDGSLPKGDMKRGIINLKLARSLNNLTTNPIIWDPFCGSGRNMAASYDVKEKFYLSDNADICVEIEVPVNYDFLCKLENKKAVLEKVFLSSAEEFNNPVPTSEKFAIVTEGWLGTNLHGNKVSIELLKKDFQILAKAWRTIIYKAHQSGQVTDIVFCLPYHINWQSESDDFLNQVSSWLQNTDYKLQFPPVIYSREKSNVGHAVIHLR